MYNRLWNRWIVLQHYSQAAGCFLYAKLVLDLVERGKIAVKAASFKVVPHSLAEVFQLMFSLKGPIINGVICST